MSNEEIFKLKIIQNYKNMMMENLRSSFPYASTNELNNAIEWAICNNFNDPNGIKLSNTYTKKEINCSLSDVLSYIDNNNPIINPSGVLFKQHGVEPNPYVDVVNGFIAERAVYKQRRKQYDKGTFEWFQQDLNQLLAKRNANAAYGLYGAKTCLFYNVDVAESITGAGKSAISSSIVLFEMFLGDNIKFNSLNEIITFITNIVHENNIREYDDNLILDENISLADCFYRIMMNADTMLWVPTKKEMALIWERLLGLSQTDLNRIFYKKIENSFLKIEYSIYSLKTYIRASNNYKLNLK